MGEYADYILNGDDCQECGEHMGEGDGFPRSCPSCASESKPGADYDYKLDKPPTKKSLRTVEQRTRSVVDKTLSAMEKEFGRTTDKVFRKELSGWLDKIVELYQNKQAGEEKK